MRVTVRAKVAPLTTSEKAGLQLAKLFRDLLRRQARAGLTGGGHPLRGVHGQRLDLRETGAMWNEVRFEPLKIHFLMPYTSYVLERFDAARLEPGFQVEFELGAKKILNRRGALVAQGETA